MKSTRTFILFILVFGLQISTLRAGSAATSVWTTIGAKVDLPCPFSPSIPEDRTVLVLWFKDISTEPIYSYDARVSDRSSTADQRWSDETIFGHRAFFSLVTQRPTLVLDPVVKEDQGEFTCRVEYLKSASTFNKVNLSVIIPPEPPVILWKGREIRGPVGPVREGEKVILVCQTKGGRPTPVVTWWQEDLKLDSVTEAKVVSGSTMVQARTVLAATRSLHGVQITCHAQAPNPGEILSQPRTASSTLNIILAPISVKITGLNNPIVAGTTIKPVCLSAGSHPLAEMQWLIDGKKLKENNKSEPEVFNAGNITSSSVTLHITRNNHGAELLCTAYNPALVGEERSILTLSDNIKLRVLYKPKVELMLGKILNATNLIEGKAAFLECVVEANPPPHRIEWFHNNHPVLNEEGIIVSGPNLAMERLMKDHSGSYRCSAENQEGKSLSNFLEVNIKYAPICSTVKERTQGAAIGQSINVLCRVESDPTSNLTFSWSKVLPSGRELQLANENITTKNRISHLTFIPLHLGDFGHFLCRARNVIGLQKIPCRVTIVSAGPPEIPKNCSAIPGSESLTINCREGFHGGFPQKFQLVAFLKENAIFNETSNFPSWSIEDLEDGAELKLEINSLNAKGRSNIIELDAHMPIAHQQSVIIPELTEDGIGPLFGAVMGIVTVLIILFIVAVTTVFRRRRRRRRRGREQRKPKDILNESRRRSQGTCGSESSPDVVNSVQYRTSSSPTVDVLENAPLDEAASIDELIESRMNSRSTDRTSDSAYYEEDGDCSVKTIYLPNPSPKSSQNFYVKLYSTPTHHYSSPLLEPRNYLGSDEPDQLLTSKDFMDDRLSSYDNIPEQSTTTEQQLRNKMRTSKTPRRKELYFPYERDDEPPPPLSYVTRSNVSLPRSNLENGDLLATIMNSPSETSKLLVDDLNASIRANMKLVAELNAASDKKQQLLSSLNLSDSLNKPKLNQIEKSKMTLQVDDTKCDSVTVPKSPDYRESTV